MPWYMHSGQRTMSWHRIVIPAEVRGEVEAASLTRLVKFGPVRDLVFDKR